MQRGVTQKNVVGRRDRALASLAVVVGVVHRLADLVRKIELRRTHRLRTEKHLEVDVRHPTWIPTGKDRFDFDVPLGIGHLQSAHECMTAGVDHPAVALAEIPGVEPLAVGVPDLDQRPGHRRADRVIDDLQRQSQRYPRAPLGDVGADEPGIEEERPLGLTREAGASDARQKSPRTRRQRRDNHPRGQERAPIHRTSG